MLVVSLLTARWAFKGFKQSKQALREATSYVNVIVGALSPRIESLEQISNQMRDIVRAIAADSAGLRSSDANLESKCQELEKSLASILTQHKQILHDLANLRSKPAAPSPQPRAALEENPVLDRLTPTERETLQILKDGALRAPELGRRVNKSREHMARLMKRLYQEGYVDRETDRPPFRYKLNDKLLSSLGAPVNSSRPENV
ncbi:MAG TPA: winged helix-turn-helix domain-containing protein [Methylomirabilota bacterium]|nr:winged helix-turn-helix domain-containing protein [Methylomirabilota bacterium]